MRILDIPSVQQKPTSVEDMMSGPATVPGERRRTPSWKEVAVSDCHNSWLVFVVLRCELAAESWQV